MGCLVRTWMFRFHFSKTVTMEQKKIIFTGNIIAVEQEVKQFGSKTVTFEKALRAPGVRLIVPLDNKLLLTREFRHELNRHDYRLAGGKVMNSVEDYLLLRGNNEVLKQKAELAAISEAREELGIEVNELELQYISRAGATIEWDLYYFLVKQFEDLGEQNLETGEEIERIWLQKDEVKQMCLDSRIDEERSAIALLRYLRSQ